MDLSFSTKECLIFRSFDRQDLLDGMLDLFRWGESHQGMTEEKARERLIACIHQLIEIGEIYGLEGNLWHGFCTLLLAYGENIYTTAVEIGGRVEGSLYDCALQDMALLQGIFNYPLEELGKTLEVPKIGIVLHYRGSRQNSRIFHEEIRTVLGKLSKKLAAADDPETFLAEMNGFYRRFGVGKFGLHKAFRVRREEKRVEILPIVRTEPIRLKDLVGYETQKQQLRENTENFVRGRRANNVLLYGDSGTGKSSSIKAILNEYYGQGLRMIEVYKHQFGELSEIIAQVKDRRYKFVIYMDDLSFEDYETEYKYLKAVIEGGLETRPDNVLIYATSNRRHLIREQWSDRNDRDDELHRSDTMQEKLSLAARFGISIFYGSPDKREYEHIIQVLAENHGIHLPEEELYLLANKWELRHGGLSGRTAQQFITYLVGREGN